MLLHKRKTNWDSFEEEARLAIWHAQETARKRGSSLVEANDLLLGVLAGGPNNACRVVELGCGSEAPRVFEEIESRRSEEEVDFSPDEMGLDATGKCVVDRTFDEARQTGSETVGSEHLLAGIISAGDAAGVEVLLAHGLDLDKVRSLIRVLQKP
ncbi:MAG: hypothetical protein JST51_02740 [Armatimonadetes bacterium]|nr:hypothetical protein [Armatimonadota bacterium]